jgi:tetratricopeptide (TPR) repeat protein
MATIATLLVFATVAIAASAQGIPAGAAAHALAAQQAERRNDFPTAVHEFEQVLAVLPRSAEMQSNLGVALYFDHQLTRAIKVFRSAILLNGELLAPHLFSGLAWFRLSNPDAAVPELETAVRINPSDLIGHTWLGYAYVAEARYEPALKQFHIARELDPNNLDVWYALGQTYLEIGKQETTRLLTLSPDGGRAWQLSGEQSQLKGDRKGALEDFTGAIQRRPDIPELRTAIVQLGGAVPAQSMNQEAVSAYQSEDDLYRRAHDAEQQAQDAFEHVIRTAPDSDRAHEIMGDALLAQEKLSEAVEEYRTVLKLKPDLPGIHEAIGNALLRLEKDADALEEFKAEILIQPRSSGAYTNVGQVMFMMGDDDGARKMLAKALEMDRPPPEVYRLLGKLNLHGKKYTQAVQDLNHYLVLKPGDSSAYYLLSKAYRAIGDRERSEQAMSLFQKTSRDVKERGRAQAKLEAINRQKSHAEDAINVDDGSVH